jgi:hypothetical protein
MNKRARVIRRKTIRVISMVLLLTAVLSLETLTMFKVYRGVSSVAVQQEVTIDPSQFFQTR